jgi:hypothetical protein
LSAYAKLQSIALDALRYESIQEMVAREAHVFWFLTQNGVPFSNPVSHAIVCRDPFLRSDTFILRVRWRSDLDTPNNPLEEAQLAVQSRGPTLEIESAECETDWALQAIAPFKDLSLLMLPKHSWGLDGVTYELVIGDLMCALRLKWWSDGPAEWRTAITSVRQTLREIESDRFKFEPGPFAFSYAVDLVWEIPGATASHLAGIRAVIPALANISVVTLANQIKGITRLHVGVFRKDDALIKCQQAANYGLKAVMYRSKETSNV